MKPQNIIIDTDIGDDVDDILALAFALLRPELAVRAITTVSFCTDTRSRMVARLLKIMGRTEVPFAPGINFPMRRISPEEMQSLSTRGAYKMNQAAFVKEGEELPAAREDAIALMAQTVEEFAGDIALVAIGPLTNIAVFLRRYPHLASKLKHIAIMGGEVERNQREHNVAWDATATDIVLSSGVPIFMGTWNVTRHFVLSPEDCRRIAELGTPLGDALDECIQLWWPHKAWKPGPVMYDVAPILWSYDRSFYPTKAMPVRIETRGDAAYGWTTGGGDDAPVEVSIEMRAEEVRALYLETICVN